MSIEAWKKVFLSGAAFNWIVAAFFTVSPGYAFELLQLGDIPANPMWLALFIWLVAVFGLGYFLVGRDPTPRRDIALLGLVGKLGVVVIVVGYWLSGHTSTIFTILVGGDLAYSILFLWFLRTAPKGAA